MEEFTDYSRFDNLDEEDIVSFEDIKIDAPVIDVKPKIDYDKVLFEKYKAYRLMKMDPISYSEVEDEYAFKFKYSWDPYTGERLDIDSNGPLCFDPDNLINHYYTNILTKLWVQPSDEKGGFYEGYYDDGAGAGEDFYLPSRGYHPEWYLFRLPIIDCYLATGHGKQVITLGPKLTDDEVLEIDILARKRQNNFRDQFGHPRPSLVEMKKLYDQAISKTPSLDISSKDTEGKDIQQFYDKANRIAIDKLVKIAGLK